MDIELDEDNLYKTMWEYELNNLDDILNQIDSSNLNIAFGRVTNISSITLSATGLDVAVGDIVRIESEQNFILF